MHNIHYMLESPLCNELSKSLLYLVKHFTPFPLGLLHWCFVAITAIHHPWYRFTINNHQSSILFKLRWRDRKGMGILGTVTIQRYRILYRKIIVNFMHILRCMASIFCVKFQRGPVAFTTKSGTHTRQAMHYTMWWNDEIWYLKSYDSLLSETGPWIRCGIQYQICCLMLLSLFLVIPCSQGHHRR